MWAGLQEGSKVKQAAQKKKQATEPKLRVA
jgi:hypothetical protein